LVEVHIQYDKNRRDIEREALSRQHSAHETSFKNPTFAV